MADRCLTWSFVTHFSNFMYELSSSNYCYFQIMGSDYGKYDEQKSRLSPNERISPFHSRALCGAPCQSQTVLV